MNDLLFWATVIVFVVAFPFIVLILAKIVGYGWEAGRHKFQQRKGRDGKGETQIPGG